MQPITIEHNITRQKLEMLGVPQWPLWSKEISRFDWYFDTCETCYIIEGEAIITPADGNPVIIRNGDLVRFAAGLSCQWHVVSPIVKHYFLGD
jgi:uncharacterized cupin superfamily protein